MVRNRFPFRRSKVRIEATMDHRSPRRISPSSIRPANTRSDTPPREASSASMIRTPGVRPGQAARTSSSECSKPSSALSSSAVATPPIRSTDMKTKGVSPASFSSASATSTPVLPAPGSPTTSKLPPSTAARRAPMHSRGIGTPVQGEDGCGERAVESLRPKSPASGRCRNRTADCGCLRCRLI